MLTSGHAGAAPQGGWVDPPAKAAPAEAGTARSEAPPASAKPVESSDVAAPAPRQARADRREAGPRLHIAIRARQRARIVAARRTVREATFRERRLATTRMVPVPTESSVPAGVSGVDPRFPGWAQQAQGMAQDYLAALEASGQTSRRTPFAFYMRLLSGAEMPARSGPSYEAQRGTMRVSCSAVRATCLVQTLVSVRRPSASGDWSAPRLSELTLAVSFAGGEPAIVRQTLRVGRYRF